VAIAPVGLLVLRAWLEEGSERPLPVEVRLTADSGRGFERELMCSEPAAVEALVRGWLDDLVAGEYASSTTVTIARSERRRGSKKEGK
jgi:hypothetical protein